MQESKNARMLYFNSRTERGDIFESENPGTGPAPGQYYVHTAESSCAKISRCDWLEKQKRKKDNDLKEEAEKSKDERVLKEFQEMQQGQTKTKHREQQKNHSTFGCSARSIKPPENPIPGPTQYNPKFEGQMNSFDRVSAKFNGKTPTPQNIFRTTTLKERNEAAEKQFSWYRTGEIKFSDSDMVKAREKHFEEMADHPVIQQAKEEDDFGYIKESDAAPSNNPEHKLLKKTMKTDKRNAKKWKKWKNIPPSKKTFMQLKSHYPVKGYDAGTRSARSARYVREMEESRSAPGLYDVAVELGTKDPLSNRPQGKPFRIAKEMTEEDWRILRNPNPKRPNYVELLEFENLDRFTNPGPQSYNANTHEMSYGFGNPETASPKKNQSSSRWEQDEPYLGERMKIPKDGAWCPPEYRNPKNHGKHLKLAETLGNPSPTQIKKLMPLGFGSPTGIRIRSDMLNPTCLPESLREKKEKSKKLKKLEPDTSVKNGFGKGQGRDFLRTLQTAGFVGPAEGPGPGSYDTVSSQAQAEQKAFHGILANHGVGMSSVPGVSFSKNSEEVVKKADIVGVILNVNLEGLKAEAGKVRSKSRQSPVRQNVKIDSEESCAKAPSRAPEQSKNAEMGYQPAIVGGKGIKGLNFCKLVNQNASELITKRAKQLIGAGLYPKPVSNASKAIEKRAEDFLKAGRSKGMEQEDTPSLIVNTELEKVMSKAAEGTVITTSEVQLPASNELHKLFDTLQPSPTMAKYPMVKLNKVSVLRLQKQPEKPQDRVASITNDLKDRPIMELCEKLGSALDKESSQMQKLFDKGDEQLKILKSWQERQQKVAAE